MQKVEITIKGRIDQDWSQWFDGFEIQGRETPAETVLTGYVPDQAALFGLLAKIRDLGLPLVSVVQSPAEP
jgi:hypothetical protein